MHICMLIYADVEETEARYIIPYHYNDVIMGAMASQITSVAIVYQPFIQGADQRKHQNSASLAFVRGSHRWPVTFRTKGQLRGKRFHLMTSSCNMPSWSFTRRNNVIKGKTITFIFFVTTALKILIFGWWDRLIYWTTGIILGMGLANERGSHLVTPTLIGWTYTQIDTTRPPCKNVALCLESLNNFMRGIDCPGFSDIYVRKCR